MKYTLTLIIALAVGGVPQLADAQTGNASPTPSPTAVPSPAEPAERPVSNRKFEGVPADRSGKTESEMKAVNKNAPHVLPPSGPATRQGSDGNPSSHPGEADAERINKTSHPGSGQSTSHP